MVEFVDEWDYLIHLIRCAIHNEQPRELPATFDFTQVFEWGARHHVANIAFYSVEKLVTKPEAQLFALWQTVRDQAVVRDINQSIAADEIRDAFRSSGIRLLEVQGTKIKPLYPQPDYRTMSDIDFIIDLEKLPKAKEILETLGYDCKVIHDAEVNGFRPPNINIELHTQYFSDDTAYYGVMRPPFSSIEEKGVYDINEFYLYNIIHIAKHYYLGGCGIRRVLDVYYLNKVFSGEIDQAYIHSFLRELKLSELVSELNNLAESWFVKGEASIPRSDAADYILGSGLHGSRKNEINNRVKRHLHSTSRAAKIQYFIRRISGSGGNMYRTYPILKRYKFLYPVCWLHRAFRALKPTKQKLLWKEVSAVMNTRDTKE